MTSVLLALWGKTKFYGAVAGAFLVAVFVVYIKGRREGAASAKAAIKKRTDAVKEKWDEIDHRNDDLDAALDRLRDKR